MMITFPIWLPTVLLVLGIFLLLKAKSVGWKIMGGILVVIGSLLLVFQIWVYSRSFRQ